MMNDKQRRFREQYRDRISPFYNGIVHVGVMFAVGVSAIVLCLQRIQSATWEWLLVLPVFLAGNFVEWFMHKYVMHRRVDVFALRAIYERHTREHHQYFTDNDITIDSTREFRIVFFPWRVLAVLGIAGGVLGWTAAQVFNANAGYILYITMVAHYLCYEVFHFCCHVHDNWFVRHMPFVNTIRRHHTAHHNQGIMMHKNMNLTFPVFDWIMGTSDLDRGLIGTLLNGHDESHIQPALRPIVARFRTAQVQEQLVSLDGPALTNEERQSLA